MASLLFPVLVLSAYAGALAVAVYLGDRERWRRILADRFYYGVPWGTLVTVAFVLGVYLFVQGGLRNWHDPTVVPFRAWSYFYPTGILTAAFTHSSSGHLIGNLVGTLALAPIAEFAWGHYPGGTDSDRAVDSSSGGDAGVGRTTEGSPDPGSTAPVGERFRHLVEVPWIRAFVCFPAAVVLVGLVTSVFALGPVIGFSGAVFAFGGFAIVRYPVTTLVALLVASVLSTTYYALQYPIVRAEVSGSAPSPPGWATVAIQGHALGILLGVVLGLALLQYRGTRPDPGRVFLAVLVYGMTRGLWAVYWFEGNGAYVLLRGLGVSLVVVLAVVVTVAAAASDRPLPESLRDLPRSPSTEQVFAAWVGSLAVLVVVAAALAVLEGWPIATTLLAAGGLALVLVLPATAVFSTAELGDGAPSGRQVAFGTVLVVTALVAGPALFPNLVTVGDDSVSDEDGITIQGYSVTYAEDVRNGMIPAVDVPGVAGTTNVSTSGVIVVNEDRHVWSNEVSKQYLESEGEASVLVGGVGWRERIHVERTGWTVTGNDTAYAIDLTHDGQEVRAYTSPPRRASPVLANHTVEVLPDEERFRLRVFEHDESVGTADFPPVGNNTSAGPITFRTGHHQGQLTVFASVDGTRVPIAQRETYREE